MLLYKHHIMGANLNAYQTPCTRIWIYAKGTIFKMNRIVRAIIGTLTALITEVDTVIARSRKACFND